MSELNITSFIDLKSFAAKEGIHRETAAKRVEHDEVPYFSRGKGYKIPSFYSHIRDIKDYELEVPQKDCITYTIGNNKGGTGKTTSTINIAASLAFLFRKRVLIIDADTQSNASMINKLHITNNFKEHNLIHILLEMKSMDDDELEKEINETIVNVESEHFSRGGSLDILPNHIDWDEEKERLFTYPNAENMLNRLIKKIKHNYDYILIDTHPSMDVIWRMSVMASDYLLLAIKPENYSLEGFSGIFKRVYRLNEDYKELKGHNIEIIGTIVSSYRIKTNSDNINIEAAKSAMQKYPKYNTAALLEPYISHTIDASDQQLLEGPVMFDDPSSKMCLEYLELTKNIVLQTKFIETGRE